jgi:hypothetical protein
MADRLKMLTSDLSDLFQLIEDLRTFGYVLNKDLVAEDRIELSTYGL